MSSIVEILSGILTGLGFGVEPTGKHNDGVFMAAFKVDAFRSLETFKEEISEFARYLKSTKKQVGVEEIYYPGELEHLRAIARSRDGVEIEDATWEKLKALGEKYNVTAQLPLD